MMSCLVTGAGGFVGANLTRRLLAAGHRVQALVRPGRRPWRLEGLDGDVCSHAVPLDDLDSVRRTLRSIRPDWVFSLAAHGAYPAQMSSNTMVASNVLGTMSLLDAALAIGFEAFVHTGSSSEYGPKGHAPAETEWLEPNSRYGVTKAAATLLCRQTGRSQRAPIYTLRLYSAYGPWEEPTRLIPRLAVAGLSGNLPPLADPRTARDYVYIDDIVDACLLAASRQGQEPGAVYNVGTGVQTSLREIVELARRQLEIAAQPRWGSMPDRAWDTDVWVANCQLIRTELGWQPTHTLVDGFARTVEWLRDGQGIRDVYERLAGGPGVEG